MEKNSARKAIVMGASSGMGHEVARLLIEKGWTVGVAARRTDRLQDLGAAFVAGIDVTDDGAARQLRSLIDRMGGIDLYLHVAGIGKQNPTLEPGTELATAQTNAVGFMRMVGEAYRWFAAQGHGHIACISSIAGTKGLGPAPAYSATKALQNVYMQALEQQARGRGLDIRFTDIRPGFVDTDLLRDGHRYPLLMSPLKAARDIVGAIEHRRHVSVIDGRWHVVTALWHLLPGWLWRRMRLVRY